MNDSLSGLATVLAVASPFAVLLGVAILGLWGLYKLYGYMKKK